MRLCVPIPCHFPVANTEDFCQALRQIAAWGYTAAETYDWRGLDLEGCPRMLTFSMALEPVQTLRVRWGLTEKCRKRCSCFFQ